MTLSGRPVVVDFLSYACTSYRPIPTSLEQGITHRPEETARTEARLVDSGSPKIARWRDFAFVWRQTVIWEFDRDSQACDAVLIAPVSGQIPCKQGILQRKLHFQRTETNS
jgi:hypothetical protein